MGYKVNNIYVGDKQIRPIKPRTPDPSRTLLYLPLENDATDMSGNNRTTSPSGISYTTVGGLKSANPGRTGYISVTPVGFVNTSLTGKTVSVLVYNTTQQESYRRAIFEFHERGYCYTRFHIVENTTTYQGGAADNGSTNVTGTVLTNQWVHLVNTCDTTGNKLYINGQLVNTTSGSSSNPRGIGSVTWEQAQNVLSSRTPSYRGGQSLNGNAREFIMENITRTADDVANYYKWIKNKLGF